VFVGNGREGVGTGSALCLDLAANAERRAVPIGSSERQRSDLWRYVAVCNRITAKVGPSPQVAPSARYVRSLQAPNAKSSGREGAATNAATDHETRSLDTLFAGTQQDRAREQRRSISDGHHLVQHVEAEVAAVEAHEQLTDGANVRAVPLPG
jgi:hypothetical protein